jgi:hypothetical protein
MTRVTLTVLPAVALGNAACTRKVEAVYAIQSHSDVLKDQRIEGAIARVSARIAL